MEEALDSLLAFVLYAVPSIVAIARKNVPHYGSVIVVNAFLGGTVIGWIVALAMACRSPVQPVIVNTTVNSGRDSDAT